MFKWNQIKFTKKKLKWNTFYDILLRESGNQFSQTKLLFGFNITMKLISFFFHFEINTDYHCGIVHFVHQSRP